MIRRSLLAALAVAVSFVGAAAAAPPAVEAPSFIVRGGHGNRVLAARAPDAQRAPASITKLMTVMVALEHARLDDMVTVTPEAAGSESRASALRAGERISVRDLAIAALVPSANDAATALAVHVGHGSVPRFVALMNAKARALGLRSTHFENPHGLDQRGHVSSARDTTTMLAAALRNPFIRTWSTRPTATIAGGRVAHLDRRAAGHASARRRQDRSHERRGVVAGRGRGAWRSAGHRRRARVAERGATEPRPELAPRLGTRAVPAGQGDRGPGLRDRRDRVRPASRFSSSRVETSIRTVRVGTPIIERVVLSTALALPVARGQLAGEVRVFAGGRLIARAPLVAADSAPAVGAVGKARWYARRTVHHLVGLVS